MIRVWTLYLARVGESGESEFAPGGSSAYVNPDWIAAFEEQHPGVQRIMVITTAPQVAMAYYFFGTAGELVKQMQAWKALGGLNR